MGEINARKKEIYMKRKGRRRKLDKVDLLIPDPPPTNSTTLLWGTGEGIGGATTRKNATDISPPFPGKILSQLLPSWVKQSNSEIEEGIKETLSQNGTHKFP